MKDTLHFTMYSNDLHSLIVLTLLLTVKLVLLVGLQKEHPAF